MKKLLLVIAIGMLLLGMVGCSDQSTKDEPVEDKTASLEMDVRLEEVGQTELLGQAINNDQFDRLRINIEGINPDFTPAPGQLVRVKIKNQVGRSQPPYTIAIEMTLLES